MQMHVEHTGTPAASSFDIDLAAVQAVQAIPAILQAACQLTGMGFAAVARVTQDRWMACEVLDRVNFGLKAGGELPVASTLCNEVRQTGSEIVIDDVAQDPIYAHHHTPRIYGLQSYIAVPIILADGSMFGTLCAIDSRPARLSDGPVVPVFRLFAQMIARHLDDQRLLVQKSVQLSELLDTEQLREHFIAILGHDLRNPLAAFQSGIALLSRQPQSERSQWVLDSMGQTVVRMTKLVDDLLDMARGRLGGGFNLAIQPVVIGERFEQIVSEYRSANPDRLINADIEVDAPVALDPVRMEQLLSNLLGNAIAHGEKERPINVKICIEDGEFVLSVANRGEPIPPAKLEKLFEPFHRDASNSPSGLGLGLYIASQIAAAHCGTLDVSSNQDETRFLFRMSVGS